MNILIRVLNILLAIAFVVLAYYIAIWVLGELGVTIPANILKVLFVILVLLAALAGLSGRFDRYWSWGPPPP